MTKAERRRAHKRAIVSIATGGYTSPQRAARYVSQGRARINERGQLEFFECDPRHQMVLNFLRRTPEFLPGYRFQWAPGLSGGCNVMKARGTHK